MSQRYLNLKAYHQSDLFHPVTKDEIGFDRLSNVLPPSLASLELSKDKQVDIPETVRSIYAKYRPTPLVRAKGFEKAIGTTCEVYLKNEGAAPTGNHKANSAYLIAYLCRSDGAKYIATETTGNWGIALAMAGRELGIKVVCFLDEESHLERPDRKPLMEGLGAEVVVVSPPDDDKLRDPLTISANAAIDFVRSSKDAYYIFGSVYNYFILPQSVVGLEIKSQLAESGRYPDIVVGTCGGGASLLGTAAVFIADILDEGRPTRIVSAEAETCPILSEGKVGLYSVDDRQHFPLLRTYGIEGLKDGDYIGGLGSTVLASSVSFFHSEGMIEVNRFNAQEAMRAAKLLHESEGMLVALETGYTVAAIMKQAQENDNKVIVANVSSGETDKHFYE